MSDQIFILVLFFLTGFSGSIFYLFGTQSLEKIKTPGLLFALGTLGGTVFFHLVPEYMEHEAANRHYILLAIPSFLVWFFPDLLRHKKQESQHSIVALIAGDALHNAFTSVLWLSLCLASGEIEFIMLPAILLHEIPHKMGNFGIMIFSGLSKKLAILLSLLASLFFFTGLFLYQINMGIDGKFLIPIIIGTLSYTFFLGLKHEKNILSNPKLFLWLASGLFLMIFVNLLTQGWH